MVPVGRSEAAWMDLLKDLGQLSSQVEILLIGPSLGRASSKEWLSFQAARRAEITRWIESKVESRAYQLNLGARSSTREWIWFLHSDSRFCWSSGGRGTLRGLERAESFSDRLLYFDLKFLPDGPVFMPLNQWGTRFRSRVWGLPFGDQGFLMTRSIFEQLGGFDEAAPFGEDHLLVWKAHQAGVLVHSIGSNLLTSARKYEQRGWGQTTLRHLFLTAKQALREWRVLQENRVRLKQGRHR